MQLPKTWLILISRTISIPEFFLKVFWLLAKHWSCYHDHWTKSWVQLFPSVTCVIIKMWGQNKQTNKKTTVLSYIPWSLVSLHALGSWAISNPSQSPMLAHCSVHEWVTAGSERWKVYCGVDPDTAHWYLSVLTVTTGTVLGSAYALLVIKEMHIFCMKRDSDVRPLIVKASNCH